MIIFGFAILLGNLAWSVVSVICSCLHRGFKDQVQDFLQVSRGCDKATFFVFAVLKVFS
jgi:hypothetical protein